MIMNHLLFITIYTFTWIHSIFLLLSNFVWSGGGNQWTNMANTNAAKHNNIPSSCCRPIPQNQIHELPQRKHQIHNVDAIWVGIPAIAKSKLLPLPPLVPLPQYRNKYEPISVYRVIPKDHNKNISRHIAALTNESWSSVIIISCAEWNP